MPSVTSAARLRGRARGAPDARPRRRRASGIVWSAGSTASTRVGIDGGDRARRPSRSPSRCCAACGSISMRARRKPRRRAHRGGVLAAADDPDAIAARRSGARARAWPRAGSAPSDHAQQRLRARRRDAARSARRRRRRASPRAARPPRASSAPDADVAEARRAHRLGVVDVAQVHDDRLAQQRFTRSRSSMRNWFHSVMITSASAPSQAS